MGLFSWDPTPAKNAGADPLITAQDGASARSFGATIRGFMSGMRRFTDDVGGALTTSGRLNAYVVTTNSGMSELRAGLTLLVRVDRDNTAEATLNVDGLGPLPWVDAGGVRLQAGRILKGRYYSVSLDPDAPAWRVQAGSSTLDEIPGLIDLKQEVATNTDASTAAAAAARADAQTVVSKAAETETGRAEVAQNRQFVAADLSATSALRTAAAADRAATATDRDAASTARDQAQAAIASGRVGYDTLPELMANLLPADGAQGEVRTGANAGTYQKSGAPGGGTWIFKSAQTVPALDTRVSSFEGVDGPGVGWLADADVQPAALLILDRAGAGLSYLGADGRTRRPSASGAWQAEGEPEVGPEVGWLADTALPATRVEVDGVGRPLSGSGPGAPSLMPDTAGTFRPPLTEYGPELGWLDAFDDSLAASASVDEAGRLVLGQCRGTRNHALDVVAAPGGAIRRETPIDLPNTVQAGPTLVIPSVRIRRSYGFVATKPGVVVSPVPASVAVSGASYSLRYANPVFLVHQVVRGPIAVRRKSDNTLLVEDTDYRVDRSRGVITGLVNVDDIPVTVSYTGWLIRVDYVSADPSLGIPTLSQGTERARAASLFPPILPAGHKLLYRVFRTVDAADMAAVHLYQDRIRVDRQADAEAVIARNRRRTARLRRKLQAGGSLKWGGYGDSITQLGGALFPYEVNTVANGIRRDVVGYFDLYDASARAKVLTFETGDGQTYTREGWNWRAILWAQRTYGSAIVYRNWGISGTDSSNGLASNGLMHGSYPDRLNALVADACDVVVSGFGQNELGNVNSYAQNGVIWQALLAAGSDVIGVTPTRPHPRFADRVDQWRFTCSELVRLGDDLGVAVIDTSRIFDPTRIAGLGVSEEELSECSMQNHPGAIELRAVGDLITEVL
ncbi:hypothetical protein [Methylobacterium flocculans]|uniref:hypothetical protein n=1 Tax=Methylobacterium flocculans TaxID=2984843 RepID=UPI0021F29B25|nr:hypothetical protein [Methylobacterium sp. FF17]